MLIPKLYFDDSLSNFFEGDSTKMKCDIYEKDGDYHIEIDIPGFDKKDIKVECDNGYLTVTAKKDEEVEDKSKNYIRRERSYGKYQRSFYIGDMDSNEIRAKFKHGMLKIIVPKVETKETKRHIEIGE